MPKTKGAVLPKEGEYLQKLIYQLKPKIAVEVGLGNGISTVYLLEAVGLGLEKYLVKPIRHETIFPILNNCVNKIKNSDKNIIYFSKEFYFNLLTKTLHKNDEVIKLTNKEIDFLNLLCENSNNLVSYETIQALVWSDSFMSEDAIRSVARKLRKKLPENSLENFSKVGYKITTI